MFGRRSDRKRGEHAAADDLLYLEVTASADELVFWLLAAAGKKAMGLPPYSEIVVVLADSNKHAHVRLVTLQLVALCPEFGLRYVGERAGDNTYEFRFKKMKD